MGVGVLLLQDAVELEWWGCGAARVPFHTSIGVGGATFHWGEGGWKCREKGKHPHFTFSNAQHTGVRSSQMDVYAACLERQGGEYNVVLNNCNRNSLSVLRTWLGGINSCGFCTETLLVNPLAAMLNLDEFDWR